MGSLIDQIRLLGRLEAVSFLVLLLVAMPLKYFADMPIATKVVGWPHGLLFVAYGGLVLIAGRKHGLSNALMGELLIAALLPFGPFFAERNLPRGEPEAS